MKPKWDAIFKALEDWRRLIARQSRVDEISNNSPSVSTVAENYRQSSGLSDPWAVLSSTIISLRTKDEVTLAASERLLKKAPSPAELHVMSQTAIEKLIYPAGFYRNKAASLKKIADILLDQYGGNVPSKMEELLALPGVGRKTANLVLNEAFDIDAICVDIHVHRISNRCGWLESKTPEETEMILREILPVKYWKRINYLLVLYGQKLCRPVSPYCSRCVMDKHCARRGVEKSR
jgi:endonuclease-3